jgi:hypothetical protein
LSHAEPIAIGSGDRRELSTVIIFQLIQVVNPALLNAAAELKIFLGNKFDIWIGL